MHSRENYSENYYVQCCVLLCILDLGLVIVILFNDHICYSTIIVHRPTSSYQQKSIMLQNVFGQHNINSYNIIQWDIY